jgi:hypothetical protein
MLACSACLLSATTYAHALTPTAYVLPVPFWLYVYGCAATLVVSFAVLGYFWSVPAPATGAPVPQVVRERYIGEWRWGFRLLRVGAVGSLLVTIGAGLVGTADPGRNINMILFWVVFLLGFTYVTLVVGDLYSVMNPWKVTVEWLQRAGLDLSKPRVRYPQAAGYWPAFVFYVILMWLELFALPKPFVLSVVLAIYTVITGIGVFLFGQDTWFRRCDVFSVFFRLVATLAPVEYVRSIDGTSWRIRLRSPFAGARNEPPEEDMSLVLFVLVMLSSTTYDGIYRTVFWIGLFWRPMLVLLQPLWGTDLAKAQSLLENWFLVYQRAGLLLSPLFYLAFYLLVLRWAKAVTRVSLTLRRLAVDFAYSLIPIVVAYNVTHYYPMLVMEGRTLPWRASDPLGLGWNLLNRFPPVVDPPPLEMGTVWHTQVVLIVVGHVISVYLAHVIAVRTFHTRPQVIISQLPLLFLMVGLTAVGLWVLSLPLAG